MPLLDSSQAVQRTQAAGLAHKPAANGPRVFAVASGKGGGGKRSRIHISEPTSPY